MNQNQTTYFDRLDKICEIIQDILSSNGLVVKRDSLALKMVQIYHHERECWVSSLNSRSFNQHLRYALNTNTLEYYVEDEAKYWSENAWILMLRGVALVYEQRH